ncbi:MAG: DUF4962 domain-containing protein [Pirellulaceae bacterium]|nr:DUF4962 domain-containing protein [Pirellulaceae bacterium]
MRQQAILHALPSILFLLLGLSAWSAAAAELTISNRPPKAGEVGYRPGDGETVRLNPPSFIWLHEKEAAAYAIQWATKPDFGDAETAGGFVWNTYTHHAPLAPGQYYWRYRYTAQDGRQSGWSAGRKVVVPADAKPFPMPTRAEQRQRVPEGHPRLFLRPEDLPRLRGLAAGELADGFGKLRAEADRILQAGPTPEPVHRGSARDKEDLEAIKYWWPNREQTERACKEAETLAFVYLLSQDRKYGEAARRWVLHLASWDPDGPTNFRLNCEAGKPMLYRPARAYDWAHDTFTPADREKIRASTLRRVSDAWESGEIARGTGHLNSPYGSHANRIWHKVGEAGIAFLGEVPEAETWLDYAVNKFYGCYPVWADDDGGWHEGVSYWSGYMGKAVWWLQVAHSALGIDGLQKPFFAQVGDYPLYIAPPGSPNSGFGDLSFRPPSSGIGGFMEYHIRVKGSQPDGRHAAYWRWWTQQWGMKGEGGILGFLYAASLPPLPAAKPPEDLPPSKVFRGIGVASLHTTLLDSRDDVHFLFKSSPFGTQSHGHNPHNTFQLNAYGDALLTTCVYRDLHGSKFHYQWAHSTVAHNGVLVDGQGQTKHTPAPHGRIVDSRFTPEWDYVVGDATQAYGDRLTRYHRHVVFVKGSATDSRTGPYVVLYDDLEAKSPATFQFLLHGLRAFEVDEAKQQLSVQQPHAGVDVQYLAPLPLAFRQWDGFTPPPTKEFPNQWHVEAGTREPSQRLGMLTVLVPYRAGRRPAWTAERVETNDALEVRFTSGGQVHSIAFPPSGRTGSVRVEIGR